MKKALIIAVVGGFLPQFESSNVKILQDMGYEVHYAADMKNPFYALDTTKLEANGIILHQVDIRKSPYMLRDNSAAYKAIRQIIEKEGIELIHCHNPVGGVIGRLCTIGMNPKPYVIYTAHGFHFYSGGPVKNWMLYYPVERLMAHRTDALVTINREDYKRAQSFRLRPEGIPVWIRGVGVDPNRFNGHKELREKMRKELGIADEVFHVVSAGEFNRNKNCRTVIEAMRQIKETDPDVACHIRYSIFGGGFCRDEWQTLIDNYQLKDMVKIVGYREDMERVLSTADVFCFASIREGLGIAAIEALMSSVPLICADNRGTREYAVDGMNAVVVNATDPNGYKEAVIRLYQDRECLERMSRSAFESSKPFTVDEASKIMRGVYERADRCITERYRVCDNECLQRA